MTTNSWAAGGITANFGAEGQSDANWSRGHTPTSTEDAVINTGASTAVITANSSQKVQSISLGTDDTLFIDNDSFFAALNGTGSNVDDGTIDVSNGTLVLGNGESATFDGAGVQSIALNGINPSDPNGVGPAFLIINGAVDLTGSGHISLGYGDPSENFIEGDFFDATTPTLTNESETITGGGTIGGDLNFVNQGTVTTGFEFTDGAAGGLIIEGSAAGGGFSNENGGKLIVGDSGSITLGIDGETSSIVNDGGVIQLAYVHIGTKLEIAGNVTIGSPDAAGSIELTGSIPGFISNRIVSDGKSATLTLVNQTLQGGGNLGDANLTLDNQSIIDANSGSGFVLNTGNNTITNGSAAVLEADGADLQIESPLNNGGAIEAFDASQVSIQATSGFSNGMNVTAEDGGTLAFGVDSESSSIVNNGGLISLDGVANSTTLKIAGNVTISSPGAGGIIELTGGSFLDQIVSDGKPASLTLANQQLQGAGVFGDADLTLDNESVIDADTSISLFLAAASVTNSVGATMEADGGVLAIASPVTDNGTIQAINEGAIGVYRPITGTGTLDVGANSTLVVTQSVSVNVTMTGAAATLRAANSAFDGDFGGEIFGAQATDMIDAELVSFDPSVHAVWTQTSSSGGTLSLFRGGIQLNAFNLAGQFNSLDFAVSRDSTGGSLITVGNTPAYAANPGDNDEWILSDGRWIESAGPGSHPAGYNVALTGDWTGSGTDGILWFDPATGDTDEWQLTNTQWSGSADLGPHPANPDGNSYQIAGTDGATDFFGNGIDDVLWTSTNSDGTIATDIWELASNGQWANSVSPGPHPAGYSVVGTGDWTGSGTDGILWFNPSTGDTDEWQLAGGQWAGTVDLGSHPANSTDGASYQIAGVGDFFDNGRDAVLWTSINSDGTIATDIWELNSSGQWMASVSAGNHPAGYQVVGVGDFTGTGTSDILWFNASTGDADEWLINNGQWAGSIDLGTHPGNFQIAGVGDFNGAGNASILWHSNS